MIYFLFICVNCVLVWMSAHVCRCWWRAAEGIGFSTAGVTDGHRSLGGSWEPNWGPLEELGMLLTAEPLSLQPEIFIL